MKNHLPFSVRPTGMRFIDEFQRLEVSVAGGDVVDTFGFGEIREYRASATLAVNFRANDIMLERATNEAVAALVYGFFNQQRALLNELEQRIRDGDRFSAMSVCGKLRASMSAENYVVARE